ncbi:MAG: right-handed parallel beta-helix repeat-containing protein [Gammaproteobacteria bacterium]|nr:right-handed parallel beta-helix repeat-containing protein [Gammaproteobacteria bacterium]
MKSPRSLRHVAIRGLLVAVSFFPLQDVLALDYYVSPTGTATWAECTEITTPCNGKTAVSNAMAGDVVYFREGIYDPVTDPLQDWVDTPNQFKYEKLPWNPQHSGTAENPIVFKAYEGETPVFLDNIWSGAFGVINQEWIIFDGFTGTIVDDQDQVISLVVFLNAANIVIRNSDLMGVKKATHHNSALIRLDYSDNILIENNKIHDLNSYAETDPEFVELAVNASGILNFYSKNLIIRNNDIYNNHYGIWDKDTEQNNQYYNNHIWGGDTASTYCASGIQINNQIDEYGASQNARAYQNIIRDCAVGIYAYNGVAINNNIKIYNNTIVNQTANGNVGIFVSESSLGTSVYNNIVFGYALQLRYYTPLNERVSLSDYNLFYNDTTASWNIDYVTTYSSLSEWTVATSLDANSIVADPLFTNATGNQTVDFKLSTNSPAKGSGMANANIGAYLSEELVIGMNTASTDSATELTDTLQNNLTTETETTVPSKCSLSLVGIGLLLFGVVVSRYRRLDLEVTVLNHPGNIYERHK